MAHYDLIFIFSKIMEQKTGFEPATPTLARLYSTAELLLHMRVKGVEPPRRKALDPMSSAWAISATPANGEP